MYTMCIVVSPRVPALEMGDDYRTHIAVRPEQTRARNYDTACLEADTFGGDTARLARSSCLDLPNLLGASILNFPWSQSEDVRWKLISNGLRSCPAIEVLFPVCLSHIRLTKW